MARFTEKVAVVTGASDGIGPGIAGGPAPEGAAVVGGLVFSRADAGEAIAAITHPGGSAITAGGSGI
jgi:NAD(P)-dependent dehydrogenase (short-subunit alcohol dehydrogenase family)